MRERCWRDEAVQDPQRNDAQARSRNLPLVGNASEPLGTSAAVRDGVDGVTPYEEEKTQRQGTTKRIFTGDDWRTPIEILELVFEVFGREVDFDPCPNPDPEYQFAAFNPLDKNGDPSMPDKWPGTRAFWNPPYSKIEPFVSAALDNAAVNSIGLIPPSTDTKYWHQKIFRHENNPGATRICFYAGRIDFLAPEGMEKHSRGSWLYEAGAEWVPYKINRYASAFVLFGEEYVDPFCRVFERVGRVVCA